MYYYILQYNKPINYIKIFIIFNWLIVKDFELINYTEYKTFVYRQLIYLNKSNMNKLICNYVIKYWFGMAYMSKMEKRKKKLD